MRCPFASGCGEVKRLEARISELEKENERLKRRLAVYENAVVVRAKREFSSRRRRARTEIRYPGRPKGYPGMTRPVPNPTSFVSADGLEECPECGSELGPPTKIKRRIIEKLPNLEPARVIEFEEIHYHCVGCGSKIVSRHQDCPPEGRFRKNVCIQTTLLKFGKAAREKDRRRA